MFGHHLVELIKTERLETTCLNDILLSKLKTVVGSVTSQKVEFKSCSTRIFRGNVGGKERDGCYHLVSSTYLVFDCDWIVMASLEELKWSL